MTGTASRFIMVIQQWWYRWWIFSNISWAYISSWIDAWLYIKHMTTKGCLAHRWLQKSEVYWCLIVQSRNKRVRASLELNMEYTADETKSGFSRGHLDSIGCWRYVTPARTGPDSGAPATTLTSHQGHPMWWPCRQDERTSIQNGSPPNKHNKIHE